VRLLGERVAPMPRLLRGAAREREADHRVVGGFHTATGEAAVTLPVLTDAQVLAEAVQLLDAADACSSVAERLAVWRERLAAVGARCTPVDAYRVGAAAGVFVGADREWLRDRARERAVAEELDAVWRES
jgi:hypothetical protein